VNIGRRVLLVFLLFILIAANPRVCDGSGDPQTNSGGHAADND
jgi:hypothetical protein